MEIISNIGEFLRELRGKRSLREIEKLSGVSHTYLSSLEKGFDPRTGKERMPSPETLKKLAEVYNYPYLDLAEKVGIISAEDRTKTLDLKRSLDVVGLAELLINNLFMKHTKKHLEKIEPQLNEVKNKYKNLLGDTFELTRNGIREFARELEKTGTHQDIHHFARFFDDINMVLLEINPREYPYGDLYYEIKSPLTSYKGHDLTNEDRTIIMAFLDGLFADRINKKSKSSQS